jgi:hypothetical protein
VKIRVCGVRIYCTYNTVHVLLFGMSVTILTCFLIELTTLFIAV